MNKDTEIDMKDVELNELDPEKQPMTSDGQAAGGEKNGSVKLKVPEDEVKFTGLTKEELMKVAGTPGWVRIRWVLLVLFWLGWLGMLAGAIAIIVKAPRCKPIPEMNWWNEGPLYQISDVKSFTPDGIKGIEQKLDSVNQLKVKGLVLGPIHTVQPNEPATLDLKQIDPTQGNVDDLKALLDKAHKKGISVLLDLTPNFMGSDVWFNSAAVSEVLEKLQAAAEHWLELGVDGIKVDGFDIVSSSPEWSKVQDAVQANHTEDPKKRALMGAVGSMPAAEVSQLLNVSKVDLIMSDLLSTSSDGQERAQVINALHSVQRRVGWGLGATKQDHLSKMAGTPALIRLYQLLLLTLPGTPVFTYGDEICLEAPGTEPPMMLWDTEEEPAAGAEQTEAEKQRQERVECRRWFKLVSDLRGKERSLLHGDYHSLHSSATSLAFLRLWDQSERYVTVVNWGQSPVKLSLKSTAELPLPTQAKVKLSTDPGLEGDSMVSLDNFTVGPGQGCLLQFAFTG